MENYFTIYYKMSLQFSDKESGGYWLLISRMDKALKKSVHKNVLLFVMFIEVYIYLRKRERVFIHYNKYHYWLFIEEKEIQLRFSYWLNWNAFHHLFIYFYFHSSFFHSFHFSSYSSFYSLHYFYFYSSSFHFLFFFLSVFIYYFSFHSFYFHSPSYSIFHSHHSFSFYYSYFMLSHYSSFLLH